jgi:hypothetical protein
LLLLLVALAVSTGTGIVLLLVRVKKFPAHKPTVINLAAAEVTSLELHPASFLNRPSSWLALKSRNLNAVQFALGLRHVKPCSWVEGLVGDQKLFLAPPVKGWILVFGSGLPDPSEDVDLCFRFLLNLSRKIGQVQFFSANRVLHHHAWVRAEAGRIMRAYAWAGATLWQQGEITPAEIQLRLHCFNYFEPNPTASFGIPDAIIANVDRVPLLAAKWSLDPAAIDNRLLCHENGIAGEASSRF